MNLQAIPGAAVVLRHKLHDSNADVFPQAVVVDAIGTIVATVDLDPVAAVGGLYHGDLTAPATDGDYDVVTRVYTDAGHTLLSALYEDGLDLLRVDDDLRRLLGLAGEHKIVDQQVFDANDQLTQARVRLFDSAANLPVNPGGAETTGLVATYQVTATYAAVGRENKYRVQRS